MFIPYFDTTVTTFNFQALAACALLMVCLARSARDLLGAASEIVSLREFKKIQLAS
jgi:hypothetical protein